jgi:hypothetical protein
MPSGSTRLTVASLYSFPLMVVKSSASASDEYTAAKISSTVSRCFMCLKLYIASYRQMVRHIRLRDYGLSNPHILAEQVGGNWRKSADLF